MEVKLIIIALLLILFAVTWILSKTNSSKKVRMGEKLFLSTNWVLLLCSGAGFILTLFLGKEIVSSHLFEILLLPALFAFLLTSISEKKVNAEEKYDEKQKSDMKDASVVSWMSIIITLFVLYAMYAAGNMSGIVFFPIVLFVAFSVYAGSLLYFYKFG